MEENQVQIKMIMIDDVLYIDDIAEEKTGIIYRITNTVNQKKYYGLTTKTLEERKTDHMHAAKSAANGGSTSCRHLYNAMQIHGFEKFQFELIETPPLSQLGKRESYYIKTFDTQSPNGYNLTTGGEETHHHPESRQKISASNRKSDISKDLPMYAVLVNTEKTQHIAIQNHPLCETSITFSVTAYGSIEAAKKACIEFLEKLEASDTKYQPTNRVSGLPRGVCKIENGYQVNKRYNGVRFRRNFCNTSESDEDKLKAALEYHKELEEIHSRKIE